MKGVILAAGRSTRLYPVTLHTPKCLLKVGNKTMIERQIEYFKKCGIEDMIVIVGFHESKIKEVLGDSVKYILNPDFSTTNNIYSLFLAKEDLKGEEFVCVYSDLFFTPKILRKCISSKEGICLAVDRKPVEGTIRVKIEEDSIAMITMELSVEEADGNFIGMAKFSPKGSENIFNELEELVKNKENLKDYYTIGLVSLINKGKKIGFIQTDGDTWVDIDTEKELEYVRRVVAQELEREKC